MKTRAQKILLACAALVCLIGYTLLVLDFSDRPAATEFHSSTHPA